MFCGVVTPIITAPLLVAVAILTFCHADRHYVDPRCNGPARYEAMSQGADCFNPARDHAKPKQKKDTPR